MKPFTKNEIIDLLLRLILGAVFIYAAWFKIFDPYGFANDIRNYELLPDFLTNIVALILPWIEFYCGIFLILGIYIRSNSLVIVGMLMVFLFFISTAIFRGLDIECGCFSSYASASKVGIKKVAEDLILLLLALNIYQQKTSKFTLDHLFKRSKN